MKVLPVLVLIAGLVSAQDTAQPVVKVKAGGTITGKAILKAEKAPKQKKIKTESDAVCSEIHKEEPLLNEEIVVKDVGGELRVQWVGVYISSKVDGKFEPKGEAVIDQKGCHYEPHMIMLMVNQPLKIKNSDPTLHNIHAMPQINKEFNFSQSKVGDEAVKTFDQPEYGFKFKCDAHSWMSAVVFVLPHTLYAVTKDDGTFEIKDVPAGEHELTFWHEKYGEQKVKVKVEDGKSVTQDVTFEDKK